jgi:methyl-accepting chemotaxis protein
MSDIQETSVDTIGGIKNLGDQIKSIWDILGIINSVASQTKIIAFNAELEASAAGEKGRNFEIVASEIRRLADNTVLSTQEIKEKINEIQRASNNLILAGEEEADRISEGWELSKKIQEIFTDLLSFTETSNTKIQNSTDKQIEFFRSVLKDLRDLSEEIDSFNA